MNEDISIQEFRSQWIKLIKELPYTNVNKDTGIITQQVYVQFKKGNMKCRMDKMEYNMMLQCTDDKYIVCISPFSMTKSYLYQAELGENPNYKPAENA